MSAWIPTTALAKELGVTRRTLVRWAEGPYFPKPKVFNRRLYFECDEIAAWKKACKSHGNIRVTKDLVCENNRGVPKGTPSQT